jgi:hypothetical protein
MTDEQVEKFIWDELKKKDVTIYDMIGLPNYGVDPQPEDLNTPSSRRSRLNRFTETVGSQRMKELLCVGEYNPYEDYPPLKLSFQDLFKFWWNRCIEQHLFVDDVLEDIYTYFTEEMRPPEKGKEQMDLTLVFDQLPLFTKDLEEAA